MLSMSIASAHLDVDVVEVVFGGVYRGASRRIAAAQHFDNAAKRGKLLPAMPWTQAQMRSIQARAHGWQGEGAFEGVSQSKAHAMASEGVKRKALAKALRKK